MKQEFEEYYREELEKCISFSSREDSDIFECLGGVNLTELYKEVSESLFGPISELEGKTPVEVMETSYSIKGLTGVDRFRTYLEKFQEEFLRRLSPEQLSALREIAKRDEWVYQKVAHPGQAALLSVASKFCEQK